MRPTEPELAYLWDIRQSARQIQRFVQGATRESFLGNEILQSAVARPLEIIGEASRKVSAETRAAHPEIPWSKMIGLRNLLIHQYFMINLDTIWNSIEQDIPVLVQNVEPLVPPEPES